MEGVILSPSDFVMLFNQTLEAAYPAVTIEGELANFRVSKNKWVYFDLQDESASIKFFGTIYNLPGPLLDGLKIQVLGYPRLHPRYGFSINIKTIAPRGEGSIKKAADLLRLKLESEGLFDITRKRSLPYSPQTIGLITAETSAAYADFIKIINERWGGVEIQLIDVYVQGMQAPLQIVEAIEQFNKLPKLPEVLVITRGGGSADDLASFNDERVVRAISASRIPTLVAIGHEVDLSLAELAADFRASTPTNAAQLVVPSRQEVLAEIGSVRGLLLTRLLQNLELLVRDLQENRKHLSSHINLQLEKLQNENISSRRLIKLLDPLSALKRGYAIVSKGQAHVSSIKNVKLGDKLHIQLADGTISASTEKING
jgi:exodeoxyribonuclease VII large subunit